MDLSEALDGSWPAGGNTQSAAGGGGGGGVWPSGGNNQPGGGGLWPGQPNAPAWPGQPTQPTWPGGSAGPAWPGGQPANPTWPQGPSQPSGPWGSGPGPSPGPGPGPGPTPPVAPQQNLTVPFKQTLPEGVYDKLLITIAGTIKPNPDKITVDLATDRDIAFHFNPRFNEGGKQVIVRNSCIGEKWGKEERELQHFPFVPGQNFEIKILCTNTEFKVAVNNSHMLDFKHRITNLRDIKRLNIYCDLMLSRVNMETVR